MFWIFITTHSGFLYELVILTLVLLFYYFGHQSISLKSLISPTSLKIVEQIAIIVIAFALFRLAGEFLKNGIAAPRPCWDPTYPATIPCPDSFSLPSGHALGAFMLAIFVGLIYRIRLICLIGLIAAILISLSRYFTGVHTLLDIAVGSALGVLFGFLLWKFYWRK